MKKLIGIMGASYCGSTHLSLILGSLYDALNIGESHWLFENNNDMRKCSICGHDCTRINYVMNLPKKSFYSSLSDKLACNTIVASDKHPIFYEGKLDNIYFHPIILFKSPERHLNSLMSHGDTDPEKNLSVLQDIYTAIEKFASDYDYTCLDYDYFLSDKENVLKYLCKKFNLIYDEKAINYWNFDHHFLGGNGGAYFKIRTKKDFYTCDYVDYRYKFNLSEKNMLLARSHPYNEIYLKMVKKFTDEF